MSKKADFVFDYPRTPTTSIIHVVFPNGEVFDIPAQIVADDRDRNYADEEEDTIGFIRRGQLDDYELIDWLSNNMNWEDVAPFAVKVSEPAPINYEEAWCNAEKMIPGNV